MNPDQNGLAGRLKKLAEEAGGTTALARLCGMPQRTMANYTDGKTEPRASDVVQIARAAHVQLDWLLTGEGPMRPGEAGSASPAAPAPTTGGAPASTPLVQEVLESVIEGMERALDRLPTRLSPRRKAQVVSTLYSITYRRHAIRMAGGEPRPMAEEKDPATMESDVVDLIRLLTNNGPETT